MKSPNTKNSEELMAEVHHDLKKLEKTLDHLQKRLTPGQILDDVVFYPHDKSLKSSLNHLKDNPVGTTFLCLGTILLMENKSHQSVEHRGREKLSQFQNTARSNINEAKQTIRDKFQLKEQGREAVAQSEKMRERAGEIYQKGKAKFEQLDSLSFMALGAALGALTGSSLPMPDQERSFIHQRLGDELTHLGDDLEKAINQSSNILKSLVIEDLKNYDLRIFKS